MITRRTLLKGAAAVSAAALGGTLGAVLWPYPAKGNVLQAAPPKQLHLNARYYPVPDVPYIATDYGNGNVWYSLTGDETHSIPSVTTSC